MKKLSFKSVISLVLALVLTLSVAYMPGISLEASAACAGGCSFTAQKIGTKYLKSESTCGKQAEYFYSCDICGTSSEGTNEAKTFKYGTAPTHNWGPAVTVPATCTDPETKVQTCTRCGEKYAKKGSGTGTGHSEKFVSNGDGTHTKICTKAGCTLHEVSDCSTKETVCGYAPLCDYCKTTYGSTLGHDLVIDKITKHPTCTEKGEALKKCSRCDYNITEEIDALDHDYDVLQVITKATCEEAGKESVKCKRSGCDFNEERVIPATGHAYKKTTFPVSCAADGYDLFECQNEGCGHTYKDNWVKDRQHNYIKTIKEATCTSAGFITYTCSVCGNTKENVTLPALGHDMTGFQVSKEPTCTEEGLLVDKCKRCARTVTETLPALGHDLDIAVIPATCTEGGFTKSTCKRCNYVEEYNNIPALGHDKKITNAIAPTCVYEGYHLYTCARCGIEDRETLPALGHEYTYTSDGNATCLQDGTRTGKCIRCPKTISDYEPGSALGHSFTLYISNNNATCTDNATEWAACNRGCGAKDIRDVPNSALGHEVEVIEGIEATCTTKGLTDGEVCKRCNLTLKEQVATPLKEHELQEEIITAPTCSESGTANYKCKNCTFTKTDAVPALGHNYIDNLCTRCHAVKDEDSSVCKHIYPDNWNVIITPDCQNKGAQVKVCTLCKNIISESLPKTGHIDHNGDSKCDSCDKKIVIVEPQKPEEKPCSCDCHAGGIKAFFFKLINFFAKIFDKNARVCDCGKAH